MHANLSSQALPRSDAILRGVLLVAIASLACPAWVLAAGEVYKSVDADGHVVYSDRPDPSAAQQSAVDVQSTQSVGDDADVSATVAPPDLQDEEQPPCPEDGYLWTPGYWAWSAAGYYWVPGEWVPPPEVGLLWTPGYWVFGDTYYVFHRGYWGPHIGYYGGINYGFGYFGTGFVGGHWVGTSFAYNRTVSNVDARVAHNVYSAPVNSAAAGNRVSFNGGPGGTTAILTAQEKAVAREGHRPPTPLQRQDALRAARIPVLMPPAQVRVNPPQPSTTPRVIASPPKPTYTDVPAPGGSHAPPVQPAITRHETVRPPPAAKVPSQISAPRPGAATPTHPARIRSMPAIQIPGR